MPVTFEIDHNNRLTIFTVTGEPTLQEGLAVYQRFYRNNPTLKVLWDFRMANLAQISNQDFQQIVYGVKYLPEKLKGGKTALLAFSELETTLLRMIQKSMLINDFPLEIEIFNLMEKAMQWFGEE
ncbi:MAG: hypothetical protein ABFS43_00930 [Thermodesulfobacteriota bacterium]